MEVVMLSQNIITTSIGDIPYEENPDDNPQGFNNP